jgi:hypothetical protein
MISRLVAQIATASTRTITLAFLRHGSSFSLSENWLGSPSIQAFIVSGFREPLLAFTPVAACINSSFSGRFRTIVWRRAPSEAIFKTQQGIATHPDQMIAIWDRRIRLKRDRTMCVRHLAPRERLALADLNKFYQNDTDASKSIASE